MSRYYNINGKEYVSVTTVLSVLSKPFLTNWKVKLGKEESDKISGEAADIGKQVHQALEIVVLHQLGFLGSPFPKLTKDEKKIVQNAMNEYLKWQKKTGFKPISPEMTVHSETYGYAGTLDCVGTIGDEIVIIDWKTSKRIYKDYYLQLAAYRDAYSEMEMKLPTQMYIFRFSKTEKGKSEIIKITYADSIKYFDLFVEALDLWRFMNDKPWGDDELKPNNIDETKYLWEQREGIHYAKKK